MDLLIVRHGIAEDRDEFAATGQPDDLRPLTPEGERKLEKIAGALHALVPSLDAIITSPLVRARQTASILADRYELATVESDALHPDAPYDALVSLLEPSRHGEAVAVVGHEPHLSGLVAWLIGDGHARITMKKAGVCLVRFDEAVQRGAGSLVWLLPPSVFRRLSNESDKKD